MAEQGKYIVIEGGDNVGKSTQTEILAQDLDAVKVREPGGTETGEQLRSLILHSKVAIVPNTQTLIMAAARSQLVQEVIAPNLRRGIHVVSDLSWVSSAAYQGIQGVEFNKIKSINEFALGKLITPDLLILLDADPQIVKGRSNSPPDRYESENSEFHTQVRGRYLEVGKKMGAVIIDATASKKQVSEEIRDIIVERLGI